jgi:hypothetical protein
MITILLCLVQCSLHLWCVNSESGQCMYAAQGVLLRGHKSSPVRHKHMLYPPSFSSPLTFDNRFSKTGWAEPQSVHYITFCHQASYLSATSHTGRKLCQVKRLCLKRLWFCIVQALQASGINVHFFDWLFFVF